jgi:hypothetical protein
MLFFCFLIGPCSFLCQFRFHQPIHGREIGRVQRERTWAKPSSFSLPFTSAHSLDRRSQ